LLWLGLARNGPGGVFGEWGRTVPFRRNLRRFGRALDPEVPDIQVEFFLDEFSNGIFPERERLDGLEPEQARRELLALDRHRRSQFAGLACADGRLILLLHAGFLAHFVG